MAKGCKFSLYIFEFVMIRTTVVIEFHGAAACSSFDLTYVNYSITKLFIFENEKTEEFELSSVSLLAKNKNQIDGAITVYS